jgi:hypothetical protein
MLVAIALVTQIEGTPSPSPVRPRPLTQCPVPGKVCTCLRGRLAR